MSQAELQRYGERKLPAGELLTLAGHLAKCQVCYRNFSLLFPESTAAGQDLAPGWLTTGEPPFHLDYDEHFHPYVENTIDAAGREIVESHTEDCPACAQQLRELAEFRELLLHRQRARAFAEAQPPSWGQRFSQWWRRQYRLMHPAFITAGTFLLLGSLGLLWWLNRAVPSQEAGQTNLAQPTPGLRAGIDETPQQSGVTRPEPTDNTLRPDAGGKSPPPQATPRQPQPVELGARSSARRSRLAAKNNNETAARAEAGKLLEAEGVPLEYQAQLAAAWSSPRAGTPPDLAQLIVPAPRATRSAATSGTVSFALKSPLGTVVRSDRPRLSWASVPGADVSYTVYVYDAEGRTVGQGRKITTTDWQPPQPLARGKSYSWEVIAQKQEEYLGTAHDNQVIQANFRILGSTGLEQVERAERALPIRGVGRALVYARAGLLDEAESEIAAGQQNQLSSNHAKLLLRRLHKLRNTH